MNISNDAKLSFSRYGSSSTYGDEEFKELLVQVEEKIESTIQQKSPNGCNLTEKSNCDVIVFLTLLAEASKKNQAASSVESFLCSLQWDNVRIKAVCDILGRRRSGIRWNLAQRNTSLPSVVDIKWKLDYIVKDSNGVKTSRLFFVIKLILEDMDNPSTREITFCCSSAQMVHLLTQLKQATRSIQNFSSKALS